MPFLRSLALLVPLALIAPMMVSAPVYAGDDKSEDEKSYDFGTKVRIELRMENGAIVKHRGELRSMGDDWRFEFEGAGHKHVLVLNAAGEEGDKVFAVTLAYDRDGTAVIAPYTSDWKVRKRDSLWTEDGSLAIALTFIPTRFEREDTSRDDKDRIKPDDNDDPLGGDLFN